MSSPLSPGLCGEIWRIASDNFCEHQPLIHSLGNLLAGEENKKFLFRDELISVRAVREKMISKTGRLECCSRKFSSGTSSFQCDTSSKRPIFEIIFPQWADVH